MKKSIIGRMVVLCICISTLFGCAKKEHNTVNSSEENIKIVCTTFPQYDWVKEVLGDKINEVSLTLLMDNGTDLHNFQPTTADIATISKCDLFIYVGGESDKWVDDALSEAVNKNMKVIDMMEQLGDAIKVEEVVEGMESEEDEHEHQENEEESNHELEDEAEDHTREDGQDHAIEEEEIEHDEHVWLSLKNAQVIVDAIMNACSEIDVENESIYKTNATAYNKKLAALDSEYQQMVDQAERRVVLFGDRFPFRYLVDDYGIEYYAAFVGCSAETEASFETIVFLANKVDELNLPTVACIDSSDQSIAKTIIQNTKTKDQSILTMDSMQSVTADEIKGGTNYLSIMEQNMNVLKSALN